MSGSAAPVGALLGALVCFQYTAILATGLFAAVGAEGATALRLGFGAVLLGLFLRPWRGRIGAAIVPPLLAYGLAMGAMNLFFYLAIRTVPLGVVVAIEFIGPLSLAAVSSRRRLDFAWIGLGLAGLLLLSPPLSARALDPAGVAFALLAGAAWAVYIVLGQRVGRALGERASALGMAVAAILALPLGLLHAGVALARPALLARGALIGLLGSALPFWLDMVVLTRMDLRLYGTLLTLEPVIAALLGLVFLRQPLAPREWAGIAVVAVAAAGAAATAPATAAPASPAA